MYKFTILLGMAGVAAIGLLLFWPNTQTAVVATATREHSKYQLAVASSTVQVAGIVTAADAAVVSAKANGVLQQVSVAEGLYVDSGTVVAVQSTPVVDATVRYQTALAAQHNVEQAAAVDARQYTAEQAAVVARSAADIAVIQTDAAKTALQAETGAVRTSVEAGITTMLDTLVFVSDNPSVFSDFQSEQFRSIVNDLYGTIPNQFSDSVNYGSTGTSAEIVDTLETMRTLSVDTLPVLDVETLGVVVMGQLRALVALYTTAEADVLDRTVVEPGSAIYTTYFANRAQLLATLAGLEATQQALQSKIATLDETVVQADQAIAVTALDESLAKRQADFSAAIAAATAEASAVANGVAAAEANEGVVTAPFSGVVSDIYVERGEYVTAGQPLFTLQGAGARELEVRVPVIIGAQLHTGDVFYINGRPAGVIDRMHPTAQGHSKTVYISLSDESLSLGESVRGELSFTTSEDVVSVPREYIFFTSAGQFVRTTSGTEYPINITLDNGETLLVRFTTSTPTAALVPSRTVTF